MSIRYNAAYTATIPTRRAVPVWLKRLALAFAALLMLGVVALGARMALEARKPATQAQRGPKTAPAVAEPPAPVGAIVPPGVQTVSLFDRDRVRWTLLRNVRTAEDYATDAYTVEGYYDDSAAADAALAAHERAGDGHYKVLEPQVGFRSRTATGWTYNRPPAGRR